MRRRDFIASATALALAPRSALGDTPASDDFTAHDLVTDGDARIARRALVLEPKHVPVGTRLPALVLLHGLGETGSERLGVHAWGERYGLVRAYERLRRPPVVRTLPKRPYLDEARRTAINASLRARPFRGLVLICPVTPNPSSVGPAERTLDKYAEWLESTLLPVVSQRVPLLDGPFSRGLDGCSLGGYVGVEVFLRKPHLFSTFGGVQSAFSVPQAIRYAERIAETIDRVGARAIHLESSSGDPYRAANVAMSKRLSELGVPHVLTVPEGPHDQPWLREVGTLEMLLFHDRQLGALAP